ncbi:hypothetical protein V4C53_46525 [Paraburkholderia azotifigens]|uniref:hypothetical protein n=1 Tax=Paraburkholderia azotifigens TaxID=2057004 RepID=UPI00317081D6
MSVVVLHDSYNDGGYRDRGEGKCLLRAGSLGEIGEPLRLSLTAFGRLPGGQNCFCTGATIAQGDELSA